MRNISLTIAALLFSAALSAQGVFANKTQSILEKVIQDYPNHFYNIKGELIGQAHQSSEYRSTLQLPGSSSCIVTLYTAPSQFYSWTCTVLDVENFEQARSRFRDIYGQLSNSIIHSSAQKTFILSGQYEEPEQEKRITHVGFALVPGVGDLKKLKVELSLRQDGKAWKISLSVNDQDPKEEAQGAMTVK